MRLGNCARIFFALTLLFSSRVYSADYNWSYGTYSDPSAWTLCDVKLKEAYSAPASTYTKETSQLTFSSDTQARCRLVYKHYTGALAYTDIYIQRSGTSCPAGYTYNSTLGQCEAPQNPCLSLSGTSSPFSKSGVAPDGYMGVTSGGKGAPGQSGCINGCMASTVDQKCTVMTSGPYICFI